MTDDDAYCEQYNADVISEAYFFVATGKRQIRRFQRPHSGLTTPR